MKKWMCILLACVGTLAAQEETLKQVDDSCFYFDVGALALPVPVVGGGFRAQSGEIGVDVSIKSAVLILPVAVRENVSVLYFPKPSLSDQYYAGAGLTVAQTGLWGWEWWDRDRSYLGPSLMFGKSYLNKGNEKRFWQATIDLPFNHRKHYKLVPVPILAFSYGICF